MGPDGAEAGEDPVSVVVIPDSFAIMGIDPGGTSGVAQGVFSARGTVKQTLRRAVRKGVLRATVLNAPPEEQAHYLAITWRDFRFRCEVELGIPIGAIWLAVEDFHLRQMAVDLSPVEVVAGLRAVQRVPVANGWRDDVREGGLVRPSASEAMTFATNERLKLWNVYDLGRGRGYGDHARAALKHVCLGVSKVLDGKW